MDLLKKALAPISDSAWELIEKEAKEAFQTLLTGRRFVDVDGPHGWDYAAVPLGRLDVLSDPKQDDVGYAVHRVMPLVEVRSPFELSIWEMDNVDRGAEDVDLDPMLDAAKKMAAFEEKAIYYNFEKAQIQGLKETSFYKPLNAPSNAKDIPSAVDKGISAFLKESMNGPFDLVVGPEKWQQITSYSQHYPIKKHLEDVLAGDIILSPFIEDMFLVRKSGGDFKLTLGSDVAIGYESHDAISVRLFFTESFTFQVLEPKAIAVFE
jgi:uncharacterized linocin/CFP29 family protein